MAEIWIVCDMAPSCTDRLNVIPATSAATLMVSNPSAMVSPSMNLKWTPWLQVVFHDPARPPSLTPMTRPEAGTPIGSVCQGRWEE